MPKTTSQSPTPQSSTSQSATIQNAAMTGRHGAMDFAAQQRALHPAAADHTYRVIELVGTSEQSIEAAIQNAIARAHQTIRHLRWFEVVRTSGHIDDGRIGHFQVTLKVGFTMEGAGHEGEIAQA